VLFDSRSQILLTSFDVVANSDETKAFFQVYEHSLVNDANFEFLEKTKDFEDVAMGGDEGQEEGEGSREYVTSDEIRRRVREQADEGEVSPNSPPRPLIY
jgi:hypothetical protein